MSDIALPELPPATGLPTARGRTPIEVECVIARSLTAEDAAVLAEKPPVGSFTPGGPKELRHAHHNVARYLAQGMDRIDVAALTGYSLGYITQLEGFPLFQELLNHYCTERATIFVDVVERMKALGLSAAEEIQARLAEAPEKFTNAELRELTEMLLVKPMKVQVPASAPSGASTLNLNVKFVTADGKSRPLPEGEMIEGEIVE